MNPTAGSFTINPRLQVKLLWFGKLKDVLFEKKESAFKIN